MSIRTSSQIHPRRGKYYMTVYSMILPNLLLFAVFSIYPILWTVRFAFFKYNNIASIPEFIGLDNFVRVCTRDSMYWKAVTNTLWFAGGKILWTIPIAFVAALLVNGSRIWQRALQAIYFSPTIMSTAVMALVFYLLFNAYNGEVNRMLMALHLVGAPINWLGSTHAMTTVIIVSVWGGIGNYMVYFLAGLQRIPSDVRESAMMDGANRFQMVWYITLPMLGSVLKIVLMLAIINAFQDMSSIMVLTEGGPFQATMVASLYSYQFFFPVSASSSIVSQYGYGAATSVVTAVIVGIITVAYLFLARKLDAIEE